MASNRLNLKDVVIKKTPNMLICSKYVLHIFEGEPQYLICK